MVLSFAHAFANACVVDVVPLVRQIATVELVIVFHFMFPPYVV
jgi:hypothetical protein